MSAPPLVLTRDFAVAPAALFDAWLDAQALARFMCPAPGVTVDEIVCEPEVGGALTVVMRAGDSLMPHTGEFRVIDRPARLAFTWCSSTAGEGSLVTLDFDAAPAGTRLTLTHTGLPSEHAHAAHQGGWTHILKSLADDAAAKEQS